MKEMPIGLKSSWSPPFSWNKITTTKWFVPPLCFGPVSSFWLVDHFKMLCKKHTHPQEAIQICITNNPSWPYRFARFYRWSEYRVHEIQRIQWLGLSTLHDFHCWACSTMCSTVFIYILKVFRDSNKLVYPCLSKRRWWGKKEKHNKTRKYLGRISTNGRRMRRRSSSSNGGRDFFWMLGGFILFGNWKRICRVWRYVGWWPFIWLEGKKTRN